MNPEYTKSCFFANPRAKISIFGIKLIFQIQNGKKTNKREMKALQTEFADLLKSETSSKADLLTVFKELGYEIKLTND